MSYTASGNLGLPELFQHGALNEDAESSQAELVPNTAS